MTTALAQWYQLYGQRRATLSDYEALQAVQAVFRPGVFNWKAIHDEAQEMVKNRVLDEINLETIKGVGRQYGSYVMGGDDFLMEKHIVNHDIVHALSELYELSEWFGVVFFLCV